MKRVLMGGSGDDGVYFAGKGQPGGGLDGGARDAPGADGPFAVAIITRARAPGADRDPAPGRDGGNLVFGPDEGDVGLDRLRQRAGSYLGADAAGVSECDRQTRPLSPSRLSRLSRPSRQVLTSM